MKSCPAASPELRGYDCNSLRGMYQPSVAGGMYVRETNSLEPDKRNQTAAEGGGDQETRSTDKAKKRMGMYVNAALAQQHQRVV